MRGSASLLAFEMAYVIPSNAPYRPVERPREYDRIAAAISQDGLQV